MKPEVPKGLFEDYGRDTTNRLSFRNGDMLIHLRYRDIFGSALSVIDLWELKDGQFGIITNRIGDFPSWFRFHPTEVTDLLLLKMVDKFNEGDYPSEPMDGPSVWRLNPGDTLVWLGDSRPSMQSQEGILKIISFTACALLVGEPMNISLDGYVSFGALSDEASSGVRVKQARNAVSIVKSMGLPRCFGTDWLIG